MFNFVNERAANVLSFTTAVIVGLFSTFRPAIPTNPVGSVDCALDFGAECHGLKKNLLRALL